MIKRFKNTSICNLIEESFILSKEVVENLVQFISLDTFFFNSSCTEQEERNRFSRLQYYLKILILVTITN